MPASASATTRYYDRDSDLDDDDWLGTGDDTGWIDEFQPRRGYERPARPAPRQHVRPSRFEREADEPEIVFLRAARRPDRSQVSVRLAVALAAPLAIAVAAFAISSLAGGNDAATTQAANEPAPAVAPAPETTTVEPVQPLQPPQAEQTVESAAPVVTTPAPAVEPEPAPLPTPEPAPLPDVPTVTLPAEGRLEAGDRGEEVSTLQQALALLDASAITGEPDGIFGPETETAVKAFQTAAGIASDGVVGPQTVEKLNEAVAKSRLVG